VRARAHRGEHGALQRVQAYGFAPFTNGARDVVTHGMRPPHPPQTHRRVPTTSEAPSWTKHSCVRMCVAAKRGPQAFTQLVRDVHFIDHKIQVGAVRVLVSFISIFRAFTSILLRAPPMPSSSPTSTVYTPA